MVANTTNAKTSMAKGPPRSRRAPTVPVNPYGNKGRPLDPLTEEQRELVARFAPIVKWVFCAHFARRFSDHERELLDAGNLGLMRGATLWRPGLSHDSNPGPYLARAIRFKMQQCIVGFFTQKRLAAARTQRLGERQVAAGGISAAELVELRDMVLHLPGALSVVILLRFWAEAGFGAIGDRLGVSRGTACTWARKALSILRRKYGIEE